MGELQSVQAIVSKFITENLLLGKSVDLASAKSLLDAGVLDSTGVLELVQFLEETWALRVADSEMVPDNLDSLEKISAFVAAKTALLGAA